MIHVSLSPLSRQYSEKGNESDHMISNLCKVSSLVSNQFKISPHPQPHPLPHHKRWQIIDVVIAKSGLASRWLPQQIRAVFVFLLHVRLLYNGPTCRRFCKARIKQRLQKASWHDLKILPVNHLSSQETYGAELSLHQLDSIASIRIIVHVMLHLNTMSSSTKAFTMPCRLCVTLCIVSWKTNTVYASVQVQVLYVGSATA